MWQATMPIARIPQKTAFGGFLHGAPKARTLEHIYIVAQWLFENRDYTIFRPPQIPALQRAEQMAKINYAY